MVAVSPRLSNDVEDILRKIAEVEDRSFAAVVMRACNQYAAQYVKEHPELFLGKKENE